MIKKIKQQAKSKIQNNYIFLFLVTIISTALSFLFAPLLPITTALIILFNFGVTSIYLKVLNGQTSEYRDIFLAFSSTKIQRFFLIGFLSFLRIILFSLLFVIPGIIQYYRLALVNYLAIENPTLSYQEVMRLSERLMKGNKFKLFTLQLSFIGWFFLTKITFGLAGIYVLPYYQMTLATFYQEVKNTNLS